MPHKQNPIKTEQLCGLARVVRGYAMTAMENIPTWEERDISQSAPERIILPDAFNLMHYMVERLTVVIEGMQVFPQRMLENINNTYGTIYSGKVKDLLIGWGVEPEVVYRLIQELSFQAITEKKNLRDLLIEHPVVLEEIKKALDGKDLRLDDCFNPWNSLSRREEIYTRFAVRSF